MFFTINTAFSNMRKEPSLFSPVTSQALFSEPVQVEEVRHEWCLITTPDQYRGWTLSSAIVASDFPYKRNLKITRLSAPLYRQPDITYGAHLMLPFGSYLEMEEEIDERWIKVKLPSLESGYIEQGVVAFSSSPLQKASEIITFSKQFLNLPYLWGGRSAVGYDCSGFVQMLYQELGILLPRDSCEQVLDPRFENAPIDFLSTGDLIFFGKSEKLIQHVAFYLEKGFFIHATVKEQKPWIRISHVSEKLWMPLEGAFYPYRTARKWKGV